MLNRSYADYKILRHLLHDRRDNTIDGIHEICGIVYGVFERDSPGNRDSDELRTKRNSDIGLYNRQSAHRDPVSDFDDLGAL